jgi:hypothetical protein
MLGKLVETLHVGPNQTKLDVEITALGLDGTQLLFTPNGRLYLPTIGTDPTFVKFIITGRAPSSQAEADADAANLDFLQIREFEVNGAAPVANVNKHVALPPGQSHHMPVVMFYGEVDTTKLKPDDVANFLGAGNELNFRFTFTWHKEIPIPIPIKAPQPIYRGGGGQPPRPTYRGGGGRGQQAPGLACFSGSHIAPTTRLTTREANLEAVVSRSVTIPIERAHKSEQEQHNSKKRSMMHALNGVVPVHGEDHV